MASSLPKLCFNSNCKQLVEAHSRKGWRRRTGEFADLCDRCGTAFEEGKFCETFHLNASGWRCCESCGKQIHCGCIVSFHMFVLLDAGGIECITCTRKSFILTPNPAWPPPSLIIPGLPERVKDLSVKKWSSIAASGPVPWRQAPSLFNPEVHPKMPLEVGISTGIDRVLDRERLSDSLDNSKKNLDLSGRFINGSLKGSTSQILENGISGSKCEKQPSPYVNVSKEAVLLKNGPSTPHLTLTLNPASKNEITMQSKVSESYAQQPTPPAGAKQFGSSNGVESSGEAPICNGRPRGDSRGRNQLLPRYWPKITDQELLQISGDTNTVITPLFEKMLTASDAGKIGRLVLPKKCAEAYLPPISNPEGMPLLVQDLKGQEWVFQFRFWPNNNSRMYVLEGVTSCIHSMQLQAGDTVTFSRLEPHGKLVIGCRKTSTPFDQSKESINTGNGVCAHRVVIAKTTRPDEVVTARHQSKSNSVPCSLLATNKANLADSANKILKIDESKYIARETLEAKLDICSKRKSTTLGSQSKRLRIENEELIELKLTRGEAQGLLRPPPNDVPKIVAIEGYEIEEFEEPPIIGRPTIVATDSKGEVIQWVQCEDCFKWRKVPGYAIFPSRWTCSRNLYDPERSLCSADQELTIDELKLLLSAAEAKKKADKEDPDSLEASEGLDALARLAIYEDGDSPASSSSQTTTKHPRHRLGCSCIVCIQTPSGKGPKHNLMSVTKQSEKEPKTAFQKPEQLGGEEIELCGHTTNNDQFKTKSSNSPFKCGIDLNIRPEREEHLASILNPAGITRMLEHATQHYLEQQKISSSGGNSTVTQTHSSGTVEGNFTNKVPVLCTSQQNAKSSDFHPILLETKR